MKNFIAEKINTTTENLERVGVELAQAVGWDGDSIMQIAMAALTDANFHELRARLERAYKETPQ
jgi:hypothetical protein